MCLALALALLLVYLAATVAPDESTERDVLDSLMFVLTFIVSVILLAIAVITVLRLYTSGREQVQGDDEE